MKKKQTSWRIIKIRSAKNQNIFTTSKCSTQIQESKNKIVDD